jgi:hypothetical protein
MTDIGLNSGDLMVVDKAENRYTGILSSRKLRGIYRKTPAADATGPAADEPAYPSLPGGNAADFRRGDGLHT